VELLISRAVVFLIVVKAQHTAYPYCISRSLGCSRILKSFGDLQPSYSCFHWQSLFVSQQVRLISIANKESSLWFHCCSYQTTSSNQSFLGRIAACCPLQMFWTGLVECTVKWSNAKVHGFFISDLHSTHSSPSVSMSKSSFPTLSKQVLIRKLPTLCFQKPIPPLYPRSTGSVPDMQKCVAYTIISSPRFSTSRLFWF
jgi:hypothetical protein